MADYISKNEVLNLIMSELKEVKRLLKAAVEDFAHMDFHIYECDSMCDTCPLHGERDNCLVWQYADEAEKLLKVESCILLEV